MTLKLTINFVDFSCSIYRGICLYSLVFRKRDLFDCEVSQFKECNNYSMNDRKLKRLLIASSSIFVISLQQKDIKKLEKIFYNIFFLILNYFETSSKISVKSF